MIFEYGEGADAYVGCGATLMGEMWYFGGYDSQQRQVSTILNRGESGWSNWVEVKGPNSKVDGPWLK